MCIDLRAQTKISLDQAILASPARAGIPTEWDEWPEPLRAFGIIGLDIDIVRAVKDLPIARTYGPRSLTPIDYVQLALWRIVNKVKRRRIAKPPGLLANFT